MVCNVPRVSSPGGAVLRSLFGCGPGRMQLGFDFASLEARIQGHFVLPFTDGESLAASLIAEKPNDCFDMETQILTNDGWKTFEELSAETMFATWHITTKTITYNHATNFIRREHTGTMIRIKGERLDVRVTPNHRIVIYNRDIEKHETIFARELKEYVSLNPNTFIPANGYTINLDAHGNKIDPSWDYLKNLDKFETVEHTSGEAMVFQSFDREAIENVALGQILKGSSARVLTKIKNGKEIYQTTIGKTPLNPDGFKVLVDEITEETVVQEPVWCVSVPSTYVIVRRNGKVSVSGNCHTINANKLGITRDNAKSFSYATMYGAQAEKLAKMLRIPLKEAERLFVAYWEAVPALKELKERVETYWKKTGRQYILGIDGRKLFVRSQHSLINLLFQSAGAVCVKYTLVGINRRLEELGMLGDPLLDTEEDMNNKVYQMIAYHKPKTLWY